MAILAHVLYRLLAKELPIYTHQTAEKVHEKFINNNDKRTIRENGYTKHHQLFIISHERINQFIFKDKQNCGDLYKHLQHQHKKYRKRYGSPKRLCPIRKRRFIDKTPVVVNEKARIGD